MQIISLIVCVVSLMIMVTLHFLINIYQSITCYKPSLLSTREGSTVNEKYIIFGHSVHYGQILTFTTRLWELKLHQ